MNIRQTRRIAAHRWLPRIWIVLGTVATIGLLAIAAWVASGYLQPASGEAPEFGKVQAVQERLPFQVLIPSYLPRDFDRAAVQIQASDIGPGGEPMAQLAYRTRDGATLFLREWIPANPKLEILSGSRPIQTKWGPGWLLTQGGDSLVAVWVDIGPLRVSVFTSNVNLVPRERLVQIAETLGPASNNQVFYYSPGEAVIKDLPSPPPVEVKTNAQGVQELTLVITPGGYDPIRFAVKKGVPVRLTFRQLGQVGCGNVLIFPADPRNPRALTLKSEHDQQVLEFTPTQAGDFKFNCSHDMFRGIITVRE